MQMPEDPTRIAHWVTDKLEQRRKVFSGREAVMDLDRRLLLQKYRQEVKGMASVSSAEPRNAVRLALDIMTRRDLRFNVMISDQDAAEQDRINDLERLCVGLWRATDRQWRQMGNHSFLRDLDWYILMGGYAVYPLVLDTPQGTKFVSKVLDPKNVFPDYDDSGVCWVANTYKTTIKELKPRFGSKTGWDLDALNLKSEADEVEVINCFWLDEGPDGKVGTWNALIVDGKVIKEPTFEKQFGARLPIITGPSSGHPFNHPLEDGGVITDDVYNSTATAWEGILAPARKTYMDLDSLLSYSAEIVRRNALGRYIQRTRTGQPKITPQQFRNMELGTMMNGEDIIPVPPPTSPAERNELLNYLTGSLQRSTLSFTAFGSLGIEISGVTLDSLINATQSVLAPFIQASQYASSEMMLSYIDQFKNGGFKPVSLEVRERAESSAAERWFLKDFRRQDIPKSILLEVTQPLSLPDTTLARLNAARTAVGDNRQLISEQAISEHLLNDLIPDHQLNLDLIQKDKVRNSPQADAFTTVNGLRQMAEDANARGDRDMAMMALTLMQATLAQFQQQFAGMQQRVAGIDAQRQAQAGAGITEPSPGVQPAEASGVRPEAVDADRLAGNQAKDLLAKRSSSVNGR